MDNRRGYGHIDNRGGYGHNDRRYDDRRYDDRRHKVDHRQYGGDRHHGGRQYRTGRYGGERIRGRPHRGGDPCHHGPRCNDLKYEYKQICNDIWGIDCNVQMTYDHIDKIIMLAQICGDLRYEFGVDCCDRKFDDGHWGAITKMDNKVRKCENTKLKKNIIDVNIRELMELERRDLRDKEDARMSAEKKARELVELRIFREKAVKNHTAEIMVLIEKQLKEEQELENRERQEQDLEEDVIQMLAYSEQLRNDRMQEKREIEEYIAQSLINLNEQLEEELEITDIIGNLANLRLG